MNHERRWTKLIRRLRRNAHPMPRPLWVEVVSGSLGQGLPIAVGIALGAKRLGRPSRVWVLCGDGGMAEGSMWEAFERAGHERLNNLVVIVVAGMRQYGSGLVVVAKRARAFGWDVTEIDGHDLLQLDKVYAETATATTHPSLIVVWAVKGKGASGSAVEDQGGAHGKRLATIRAGWPKALAWLLGLAAGLKVLLELLQDLDWLLVRVLEILG